ncbi:kinase-like protein [Phyllosticta citribraziliensis]|uniref:Kinase-like protein n=1 Tax=Phyllosticta citribraziliensis TaxID=989973 RepID=A0ABR1LM60_9PEZI
MSLVPRLNRGEIVLRHGSAVVVYDARSRQLSLRATPSDLEFANCPYCQRPFRDGPTTEAEDDHEEPEASFVNPQYFRMLHHSQPGSPTSSRPTSPVRGTAPRALRQPSGSSEPPPSSEFIGSSPAPQTASHGISSTAFSQNYFKTFFVEERVLGSGGKGVVLLVKHVLDGVSLGHFACKRVPVGDDHEWLEKVLIEVQLLQNLSHQNLVSYRHVWLEEAQLTSFAPSVPCAFILQQYCNGGDLHHYILGDAKKREESEGSKKGLKERMRRRSKGQVEPPVDLHGPRRMHFDEIFSFFKDITSGLHHLHSNGYIHRDLKPHNCLLHTVGGETRVLVSDFGEVQTVNMTRKSTGATGTLSYCAPEVLMRETPDGNYGNFTTKSDIFSLGMIVYFMCFGRLPYKNADDLHEENEDLDELRAEIATWRGFNDTIRARSDLPEMLYAFLKKLLSLNPKERPATDHILQGIGAASTESNSFHPSFFNDMSSRISPADSPSPAPKHARRAATHTGMLRTSSKLRHATAEEQRSPSPPMRRTASRTPTPEDSSTVVLRTRKVKFNPSPTPQSTPRLMLPPPTNFSTRIHSFLQDYRVLWTLKISMFLLKVTSLTRPCSPFAPQALILYPLLFLAALDLALMDGMPASRWSYGGLLESVVLLAVHFAVAGLAAKSNKLCMNSVVWHEFAVAE